jgi:hypothetical protein
MLGYHLHRLIEKTVRGLFVTAAIRSAATTALRSSDDPQLVIGQTLFAPMGYHRVDLSV